MKKNKKGNTAAGGQPSYTERLRLEKREKLFWQTNFTFPGDDPDNIPVEIDWVKFRYGNLDDEGVAFFVGRVKKVGMLDIYEAPITNAGIGLLAGMEYVRELRLKECRELDNDCMEDMVRIKGLELLYVMGSKINLDGLEKIGAITGLKELFISSDLPDDEICNRIIRLKQVLPGCEFIVNHTPEYRYLEIKG